MKKIADIVVMFLVSSLMVISVGGFMESVISVLISITLISVTLWVNKSEVEAMTKNEKYILLACFINATIIALVIPIFSLYLPVLIYVAFYYNRPIYSLGLLVLVYNYQFIKPNVLIGIAVLTVISIMLALSTSKMLRLEDKIKIIRDSSIENDLKLKAKNRQIIINQDNEIHLATLKERNRIAREIHDNVGHMLTRSILQVGALAAVYKDEPLHSNIKEINDSLNVAMNNIRESVHDIHDESVDLKQAIYECTREVSEKYDLKLDYDMSKHIPKKIKYSFIAIVKEAMSNIVKHSNASEVYVMVREHPGFYQLIIEDNGNINEKEISTGDFGSGIGLVNMNERVNDLKGRMRINTEDGFKIFITVPKRGEE